MPEGPPDSAPPEPKQDVVPDEGTPRPEPAAPDRMDVSPFEVPDLDVFHGSDDSPRPDRDND